MHFVSKKAKNIDPTKDRAFGNCRVTICHCSTWRTLVDVDFGF